MSSIGNENVIPQEKAIMVWHWQDAPAELKALSQNGGDEDWVALVPTDYPHSYIAWLTCSTLFDAASDPQKFTTENGTVYIGSHA